MKAKKLFAMLLSISMLFGICCSCKSDAPPVDSEAPASSGMPAVSGEETCQFTYTIQEKFAKWALDNKWIKVAEERTNTDVEFIPGGASDSEYSAGIDQMIISNTFPDAGIISNSKAKVYGEQGAFVDLAPYIAEHAPNLKAYIDENPAYANYISTEDGAIYGLAVEYPKIANLIMYRADHFEKAGIKEVPTTIEEFTEALRALKAHYGTADQNYYPLSGRDDYLRWMPFFNCYANFDGGVSHGIYDATTGYDIECDGFKAMVEWCKTLYDEGLIDPEWVYGIATEETWGANMLTGKCSVSYDFYTRPAWYMLNGGPENDPDYQMAVMPFLKDMNGNDSIIHAQAQYRTDRSFVINSASEDKTVGILKFIDYLFSEEGQILCHWGVEGESYEVVDGEYKYLVSYDETESNESGTEHWSFLNDRLTFPKPVVNEWFYQWNNQLIADATSAVYPGHLEYGTILTFNSDQATEYDTLVASVKELLSAEVKKFVIGERDMAEFDDFVSEMKAAGYSRILEIQQEVYDSMYK